MDSFGTYLKSHREKKGIRLEEIASITKIHLHILELLEAGRWDKLPPEPFIKGFIVAYGKYVGLEPKELIQLFRQETNPLAPQQSQTVPSPPQDRARMARDAPDHVIEQAEAITPKKIAATFGVVLIVGLLVGIVYLGKHQTQTPASKQIADVQTEQSETTSQETSQTPALDNLQPPAVENMLPKGPDEPKQIDAMTSVIKGDPKKPAQLLLAPQLDPTPVPQIKKVETPVSETVPAVAVKEEANQDYSHHVSIEGNERTWIKIVIDNKPPIEYFLPEGNKVSYKAKEKIKVVLGNSTGSKVFHNGELNEGVKFLGTIRSYKFPGDAKFPQDTASKRNPSSMEPDI